MKKGESIFRHKASAIDYEKPDILEISLPKDKLFPVFESVLEVTIMAMGYKKIPGDFTDDKVIMRFKNV